MLFRILSIFSILPLSLPAADWPRWMGETNDGRWREEGVRKDLPAEPKVLWRAPVGWGYSSPVVSRGRVFVSDYLKSEGELINNPGKAVTWQGEERLLCLDADSGKVVWTHSEPRTYELSFPGGPRAAPTFEDGRVYYLGAMGNFFCLDAEKGNVLWKKDLQKDFDAPLPIWGFSAPPLVHGDLVYLLAGGPGSVVVALDKVSGKVKWKALDAENQGYCPPSIVTAGGVEQLLVWHPEAINGLNPLTGETYWSLPLKPNYGMSVMTPQLYDGKLFASRIGSVGALIELDATEPKAKFLWRGNPRNALYACNSTPLIVDGIIYGADVDSSELIAARIEDGERLWSTMEPTVGINKRDAGRHGTAFLAYHPENKQFWLFSETGDLILAELSAMGYSEIGRQPLLEPTNEAFGRPVVWSAPAFAMRSVFAGNDRELVRADLSD